MKIFYGIPTHYVDVTQHFFKKERILIPASDDRRNEIFGDPLHGLLKHILVVDDYGHSQIFDHNTPVIMLLNDELKWNLHDPIEPSLLKAYTRLQDIHNTLQLSKGASLNEEMSEQLMAMRFIKPDACVLEIGANVGRNTCVIGKILYDSRKLVSLESSPFIAQTLQENKKLNNLCFHIEDAALSKRTLIQKGWDTKEISNHDAIPDGWFLVKIINWDMIKKKYASLTFDTLVADCEGALYYIVEDEPNFFSNFKTIIMENDYGDIHHKNFINDSLYKHGFKCVYHEKGGWGPCLNRFWETWVRE